MPPRPLLFTWPYALAYWGVFVWAFAPEWGLMRRSRSRAPNPQDAGSLRVILLGNQLAMALGFALAWLAPAASIARHREAFYWLGVALLATGSLLRRHCFRMLGQSFTGAVQVRED